MNLVKALNLMKKYIKCPNCGCETVGAGTGTIDIDTEAGRFIRTCHCGWKIEIQEDTNDTSNIDFLGKIADSLISNGVTVQKHARWEWRERPDYEDEYECLRTNCGKHAPYTEDGLIHLAPYCQHCGAIMDGGNIHGQA